MLFRHAVLQATLLASVSALVMASQQAAAVVIDYPNGSTRSTPIVLTDNSTQLRVTTGSATQAGGITQTGGTRSLEKIGSGALALAGTYNYTGGTTVSAGTLDFAGGASGLNGNIADNGVVRFSSEGNILTGFTYQGMVTGSGAVRISNRFTLLGTFNQTGGTVIDSGATLHVGNFGPGTAVINGNVTNNGLLDFFLGQDDTYAGVISGSGGISHSSLQATTLTGNNTYAGSTNILRGGIRVGNGGTTGTLGTGLVSLESSTSLTFNRSDATAYAGGIFGLGSVTKMGAGTLTLSGTSNYQGPTNLAAGTLLVTGAINNSTITTTSGTMLGGTGTVSRTTMVAGSTLSPGTAAGTIGTLSVNDNLSLLAGSAYNVDAGPGGADRVTVSGITSIAGNLTAAFQTGSYTPATYTLLSSAGGINGTFANFSTAGVPSGFRARLAYDTNTVYLLLQRDSLLPLLGSGTLNQLNVAGAIDRAVSGGASTPAAFDPLYSLSGPALGTALNQLDGQVGAQAGQAVSGNFFPFLQLLMGAAVSGGNDAQANFAPGKSYADADAPHQAQLAPGALILWGAVFGGTTSLSSNTVTGAQGLNADGYRFAIGAKQALEDGLTLGVSIAGGQDKFDAGNGHGRGGDLAVGLHARKRLFDSSYVAAAMGFGWASIETTRFVTVSGTDVLVGKLDAETIGGRIETGYAFSVGDALDLTPFAAFTGAGVQTPAYGETVVTGSNAFALNYQARSSVLGSTELGARLGYGYAMDGATLRIEGVAGWMHSLDDTALAAASFQSLANSGFQVFGVSPAKNSAILGLNLKGQAASGLLFDLSLDSRSGDGSSIVTGMGSIGWHF